MRPCDCKDSLDAESMNEQGIAINEWSLLVAPATVEIEHRVYGKITLPMSIFTKFAKWYLEDQEND
jgi:hypothetical protein